MAKAITFDKLKNLRLIFEINYNPKPLLETGDFYPARLTVRGNAIGNGVRFEAAQDLVLGSPSNTEYTPKQIYNFIQNKMGADIADKIKALYLAAIEEDITV